MCININSFDLMYGITESEKYHLLSPTNSLLGILDQERDTVLRDHVKVILMYN